jgi:hypothetical protein
MPPLCQGVHMAKATKAQKAALRRAKERSAKRDKRQPLTPIDQWAIAFVEFEAALIRQGYDPDKARWVAQETIVPRWPVNDDIFDPFDDEEEDED